MPVVVCQGGDMSEARTPTLCIPIESRASVEAKALRILLERRLTILDVGLGRVIAECRGTERVHRPSYVKGRWSCDCEGRARCSHLVALQYVTVRPED